ncbi:MAG: PilZ domain-containing protein [Deltaproteobacteria bacterium]
MEEENFFDRRIFERIPAKISLKFMSQDSDKENSALTNDVSAKGLSLIADEHLMPNTPLEMWLQIPDRDGRLYARGRVVWSERLGPNQYRSGVDLERPELMGMSVILRNTYRNRIR